MFNPVKLLRLAKGVYETPDHHYAICDAYDPSGPAPVREGKTSSIRWEVKDERGLIIHRNFTLARCREWLACKLESR
jgi:hypothetical protein